MRGLFAAERRARCNVDYWCGFSCRCSLLRRRAPVVMTSTTRHRRCSTSACCSRSKVRLASRGLDRRRRWLFMTFSAMATSTKQKSGNAVIPLKYSVSKIGPPLHFQVTLTSLITLTRQVQYQQFTVHIIAIKIFTYTSTCCFAKCLKQTENQLSFPVAARTKASVQLQWSKSLSLGRND